MTFLSTLQSSLLTSVPFLDPVSKDYLKTCSQQLLQFIKKYSWIYDYHAADLFTMKIFETRCPQHWQHLLHSLDSDEEFIQLWVQVASKVPDALKKIKEIWPPDLVEFIQEAHSMSLSKFFPLLPRDSPPPSIDPLFTNGMNAKKLHEVPYLSSFIYQLCALNQVERLIDLGAGQGYLSSILAFQYGFHIIGLDTNPVQIRGAHQRLKQLKKAMKSKQSTDAKGSIAFVQKHVTPNDTFESLINFKVDSDSKDFKINETTNIELKRNDVFDFNKVKNEIETMVESKEMEPWGFIGLHTCGDLSPTTLRLWQASKAKLVVNIGCCYNLLTEPKMEPIDGMESIDGFPMSKALSDVRLGWIARLLACQCTVRWTHEYENCYNSFVRHFYRALIQTYLVHHNPSNTPIKTFQTRRGKLPQFEDYARTAFQHLNLPIPEDLKQRYTNYWVQEKGLRKVCMMWTLRAQMAEALEALILIDRCLWVCEQSLDYQVYFQPLFDPLQSPRNYVIACFKGPFS